MFNKILIILSVIIFSSNVFAEIVVCKDNFNKTYFSYDYYEINDFSKELKLIKSFNTGEGYNHDDFKYYDKAIDKHISHNTSRNLRSEPYEILHFSENEIIFVKRNQKEIGEYNIAIEIKNNKNINDDGTIDLVDTAYHLPIDAHYIFQLDRVMGFLLSTGIKVNKDGSYKLSDEGFTDIVDRKTIKCYGKNFLKE